MSTLLKASAREEMERRLAALRPDTPARWGKFTAPRMLAHAIQSVAMMTGDVVVKSKRVPWLFRNPPFKHLLIYVLPMPKGLPTAPELLARETPDVGAMSDAAWAAECQAFSHALARIPAVEKRGVWPVHPAFGALTGPQWGVQQYRHLDHHFRQFGL